MSGGRFDYQDQYLRSEIFGYRDKPINVFEDREISELIWDVLNLIHDYDLYASCDTDKTDYLKTKQNFKHKWFGPSDKRIKHTIDEALDEVKKELYETYEL